MSDVLKGNFPVSRKVEQKKENEEKTLTAELERKLFAKLGGSVCYVKGKPFIAQPKVSSNEQPDDTTEDSK